MLRVGVLHVQSGRVGRKAGKGVYDYDPEGRRLDPAEGSESPKR